MLSMLLFLSPALSLARADEPSIALDWLATKTDATPGHVMEVRLAEGFYDSLLSRAMGDASPYSDRTAHARSETGELRVSWIDTQNDVVISNPKGGTEAVSTLPVGTPQGPALALGPGGPLSGFVLDDGGPWPLDSHRAPVLVDDRGEEELPGFGAAWLPSDLHDIDVAVGSDGRGRAVVIVPVHDPSIPRTGSDLWAVTEGDRGWADATWSLVVAGLGRNGSPCDIVGSVRMDLDAWDRIHVAFNCYDYDSYPDPGRTSFYTASQTRRGWDRHLLGPAVTHGGGLVYAGIPGDTRIGIDVDEAGVVHASWPTVHMDWGGSTWRVMHAWNDGLGWQEEAVARPEAGAWDTDITTWGGEIFVAWHSWSEGLVRIARPSLGQVIEVGDGTVLRMGDLTAF